MLVCCVQQGWCSRCQQSTVWKCANHSLQFVHPLNNICSAIAHFLHLSFIKLCIEQTIVLTQAAIRRRAMWEQEPDLCLYFHTLDQVSIPYSATTSINLDTVIKSCGGIGCSSCIDGFRAACKSATIFQTALLWSLLNVLLESFKLMTKSLVCSQSPRI